VIEQVIIEKPAALFIGVGVSNYTHEGFAPLPQAIYEAKELAKILETHHYEAHVIEDPIDLEALTELKAKLPVDILGRGGCLVMLWSGHGMVTTGDRLNLVSKDSTPQDTPLITPEYLAGLAARSGANQILIIFDTCFSGSGVISAGEIAFKVMTEKPPANPRVWVGVVSSTLDYGQAKDGVFGDRLLKLLRHGPDHDPKDKSLIYRWSDKNNGVMADDLIYSLIKEWDIDEQRLKRMVLGDANCELMFPNPMYNPDAPDRIVEHLLLAARGVEPGEEGFFFTGRAVQINRIVSWMQAGKPGVYIVTGPAGSGKSAIVGRIVSLSNPEEREQLLIKGPLEHSDPGKGAVHAHVHVRGVTTEQMCQLIDEQLVRKGVIPRNPSGLRNKSELLGALQRVQCPPVLVIDGLDESGTEAWRMATDVIRLLADASIMLVSTRDLAPREDRLSLFQFFNTSEDEIVDLGSRIYQEETQTDVRRYIENRLANIAKQMDAVAVAEAIIARNVPQGEGIFLLARVITAQLRTAPVDTSEIDWEVNFECSVEAAFDRDLARIPALFREKKELPHAARELLTALAWGYGSGLPDDIWPIMASALSCCGSVYERQDVFWVLDKVGRYIVEAGEGGRAVYRLSHQRLVEYLRRRNTGEHGHE